MRPLKIRCESPEAKGSKRAAGSPHRADRWRHPV